MDQKALKTAYTRYLAENREALLQDWIELVRQPSVSDTGEGVEECCDLIIRKMERIGIAVTKHPVKPYPVIEGRYGNDPKKRTVLIYAHYDVQPVDPIEKWRTPPFEPTIIDGKLYGRGSADNKSPLMAHLEAVDFWLRETGELPVNLILLFEGCEESSSLGLPEFLRENRERLAADLVFFSDGPKDPSGLPIIALGAKGMVGVRLTLRTMKKNVHSRYAPVLPSAAWQMVELLSKLKTGDRVNIPGFYDGITPPSEREREILESIPGVEAEMEADYGVKPDCHGRGFYDQLNNTPTFNISLLTSGATAGVVPAEASANIDIRLVAGMDPQRIYRLLADYIRELGYDNVTVECTGAVEPSKTDVNTPWLPVLERSTREVYGKYVIYPCRPSTAPDYLWTNILGLPAIQVRWSDPDSDNHAPNEHLSVEEYFKGIAMTIQAMGDIAAAE